MRLKNTTVLYSPNLYNEFAVLKKDSPDRSLPDRPAGGDRYFDEHLHAAYYLIFVLL